MTRPASFLTGLLLLVIASPALAAESMAGLRFATDQIVLVDDDDGVIAKIPAASIMLDKSSLLDHDKPSRMFKVQFPGYAAGWVPVSDFMPLPATDKRCVVKAPSRVARVGQPDSSRVAGNLGLFTEVLCP